MPINYGSSALGGYDSIPQAITQKALLHNFNLEEKERREQAVLNKDFYYGKQEQAVFLLNIDVAPVTINLMRPVMAKRTSLLYARPLKREFAGPPGSIAFLEQVYKDNRIDQLLQSADLLAELTGSTLVFPYKEKGLPGGIKLRLYDASQFSATGKDEDPNTADAISLVRTLDRLVDPTGSTLLNKKVGPQIERILQQQVWTNELVTWYEGDIAVNQEPNTLGFLPFVNFKGEEVMDQYVGYPPGQNVRKLNAHYNQVLTELGYTLKMQAGTPIVFQGYQSGETVIAHPGRAINVPAGAGVDALQLNPKINEMLATLELLEDRLYTTSSVPRISVVGGGSQQGMGASSGRELLVRWFPLMSVFTEKTVRFEHYELDLANVILAVAGMEPIEEVNIDWPEESILPFSTLEETLEQDISLNIVTPIDEIIRRNPDLSPEEAARVYESNIMVNGQVAEAQAAREAQAAEAQAAGGEEAVDPEKENA